MEPMNAAWKIAAALPALKDVAISGVAVYHAGVIIRSTTTVMVKSKSRGWVPVTRVARNGWYCHCEGYRYTTIRVNDHPICKHVMAALFAVFRDDTEDEFVARLKELSLRPLVEVNFVIPSRPRETSAGVACPEVGQDGAG